MEQYFTVFFSSFRVFFMFFCLFHFRSQLKSRQQLSTVAWGYFTCEVCWRDFIISRGLDSCFHWYFSRFSVNHKLWRILIGWVPTSQHDASLFLLNNFLKHFFHGKLKRTKRKNFQHFFFYFTYFISLCLLAAAASFTEFLHNVKMGRIWTFFCLLKIRFIS